MLVLATGFGLGVLLTALAAQPRKSRDAIEDIETPYRMTAGTITLTCAPFGADSPSQRSDRARAAIAKALK